MVLLMGARERDGCYFCGKDTWTNTLVFDACPACKELGKNAMYEAGRRTGEKINAEFWKIFLRESATPK